MPSQWKPPQPAAYIVEQKPYKMFAAAHMSYTEQEITNLIRCPKKVLEAPRREMKAVDGFRRNDLSLIAEGVPGYFYVFMRQTEDFPENFSIGLRYDTKDGSGEIILLRCNGPHGPYNNSADPNHPHWDFHVHRASQKQSKRGSGLRNTLRKHWSSLLSRRL